MDKSLCYKENLSFIPVAVCCGNAGIYIYTHRLWWQDGFYCSDYLQRKGCPTKNWIFEALPKGLRGIINIDRMRIPSVWRKKR